MSSVYDFRDYDKNLSLKLSIELWLVAAYLMRPYIALISTLRMGRGGAKGIEGVDGFKRLLYSDDFSLALGIAATVPVILFFFALMRRKPGAGAFVRSVWRNGRILLAIAAVLNIIIVFVPIMTGVIARIHTAGWVQVVVPVIILAYLFTSRRVTDTFADFPKEQEAAS